MLKRKDWQYFKEQQKTKRQKGPEDKDGDESDSDESKSSGGSVEVAPDITSEDDSDEEEVDTRRLEDLSEDDFDDSDGEDLQEKATALKVQWLAASKEDAAKMPRAALACRLCKGVLMLGPVSLRQHLESKRHTARRKCKAATYEAICFASGHVDDSTVETHQERLQRARRAAQAANKKTRRAQRRQLRIRKAGTSGKPGKRQREALKAAAESEQPIDARKGVKPKAAATKTTGKKMEKSEVSGKKILKGKRMAKAEQTPESVEKPRGKAAGRGKKRPKQGKGKQKGTTADTLESLKKPHTAEAPKSAYWQ